MPQQQIRTGLCRQGLRTENPAGTFWRYARVDGRDHAQELHHRKTGASSAVAGNKAAAEIPQTIGRAVLRHPATSTAAQIGPRFDYHR